MYTDLPVLQWWKLVVMGPGQSGLDTECCLHPRTEESEANPAVWTRLSPGTGEK